MANIKNIRRQLGQLGTLFAFSCIAYIGPCVALSSEQGIEKIQNLEQIKVRGFDEAHQSIDFKLATQDLIYIETPSVEFNMYWRRTHRTELTSREEEKISKRYSELLSNVLEKKLTKSKDLNITDDKSLATYILRPEITGLFINSPDFSSKPASHRSYSQDIGHATITLTLEDASSGQTILQLKDTGHVESNSIGMERINRAVNARYFKNRMNRWASHFQTHLTSTD